jgi:hypothetical protein
MEIDKEFLEKFVDSLTELSNDNLTFTNMPKRQFVIRYSEKNDSTSVFIEYLEDGFMHVIYYKQIDCSVSNLPFNIIYFELLRLLFLTIDSKIGQFKDNFGNNINFLSGTTLLSKGIKALNSDDVTVSYKEKIAWYIDDKKVGESHLPEGTMGGERDWLAFKKGVKEYNNFVFIRDGKVRLNGNENIYEGMPYGEFSGKRYSERIKSGYFE